METKQSNFKKDWDYSENHMPAIIDILKANISKIVSIEIANQDDDMNRSTDLKINVTASNVAVRIRRPFRDFRDITIRAKKGNLETEIHKLRKGYADFYLYLWECDNKTICDWRLIDINAMRKCGLLDEERPVKMNNDGYTGFIIFTLPELEKCNAIIAKP